MKFSLSGYLKVYNGCPIISNVDAAKCIKLFPNGRPRLGWIRAPTGGENRPAYIFRAYKLNYYFCKCCQ
ncbi:hypothetical protein HMPREF3213_03662 [Heyndrickxia coagulans]|uniref:Uncharacterized protein n=1 Tax=Heyndrickxia coagulans TaxID=1398 RepID=A0A133KB68_HEYCO|nr:hypothetical protein HMPREF3213_03662 [Heyndrickxia coagulans]